MKILRYPEIHHTMMCATCVRREVITAAVRTRDIADRMVRVKSSNVWAVAANVRDNQSPTGDIYVQFKDDHGGPGDLYVYYDVPVKVYQKWMSAPSKGHYFWMNIRNRYQYSKLTGDKRGKLDNAVN